MSRREYVETSSLSGSLHHHFAYLNDGGQVGVVRNVGHDLFRVRPEGRLKRLDGSTEDVAHAHVGRRGAGCAPGKPFVDGVVKTCPTQAFLDQWHMLVAVVLMVETGSRGVRVHHADLDHHDSPSGEMAAPASGIEWSDPVRVWPRGQTGPDGTAWEYSWTLARYGQEPEDSPAA